MLNAIAALILSVSSLHVKTLPEPFMDCVNGGGQVYSLSDGSLVCEEHR